MKQTTHTYKTNTETKIRICVSILSSDMGYLQGVPWVYLIHFNVYELTPDSDRGGLSPGFKTTVV